MITRPESALVPEPCRIDSDVSPVAASLGRPSAPLTTGKLTKARAAQRAALELNLPARTEANLQTKRPHMQLIGTSAVVTGSTKGIGFAVAELLLLHGANVVISGRDAEIVARSARDLESRHPGRRALPVAADVTSGAEIESLLDRAEAEFGPLAIMVNNAGGGGVGLITELSDHDWDAVLGLNLTSAFFGTRGAMRRMQSSKTAGAIINIGSVETYGTTGGNAHYTAAKAGVTKFTQVAALEGGPFGIRVNSVSPGVVRTPLTEAAMTPAFETAWRQSFAIDRFGEPADIAQAVTFLASTYASWITGVDLLVDGGTHLRGLPDYLEHLPTAQGPAV